MESTSPQERYTQILLEKVREDRYPSADLMDRAEAVISNPEQAGEYVDLLYEKVASDRYPSKQMLDRVHRLATRLSNPAGGAPSS